MTNLSILNFSSSLYGVPLYMWSSFIIIVLLLLAFDLGILSRKNEAISIKKSFLLSGFYILIALLFGGFIAYQLGTDKATEYITGFIIEKTLAIDNVFIIAMIFGFFNIPILYQHKVLVLGILGVLILRAIMIFAGAAIVSEYEWILYVFAAFLIFTGIKMLFKKDEGKNIKDNKFFSFILAKLPISEKLDGQKFLTKQKDASGNVKLLLTPLFIALIFVEFADLIFAIDSIPAIFAITTDPFIVYTSNIFAILGLRALYFALAAMIHKFEYLKYSLGVLLVFIGSKIFIAELMGLEKFPPNLALGITFIILAFGIIPSFFSKKSVKET